MDELRGALDQDSVSRALDNLPKGLDETYQRIFGAIDAKAEQNVRRILMWLAFERGTIKFDLGTLAELYAIRPDNAVAIEDGNRLLFPNNILKMMPGLIITDSNGEIRIAHYSIQQYLLSSQIRKSPAAPFAFSESDAHMFIGHSWLALHIQRQNGGSDPSLIDTKIESGTAARRWPYHLNMVPHENWPESVKRKTLSALAARSKIMERMLSFHDQSPIRRTIIDYNKNEVGLIMLRQPHCFTALQGFSNLTHLLLSDCLPGANQYLTRDEFNMALCYAAAGGHNDIVEMILDMGVGINAIIDPYSRISTCLDQNATTTSLMAAIDRGQLSTSETLLQRGADINARDSCGRSIVRRAVDRHNVDVVQFLLDRGADIDARDNDGYSALQIAFSQFWRPEMGMLLYEKGADYTMLPLTAVVRHINWLKVFLNNNPAKIDQTGPDQLTALHKAAGSGDYKDAFDLLLIHGADVNATSEQHGTPLHQACISGTVEYVISLLEHQNDLEVSCTLWGTALQAACRPREMGRVKDEQSRLVKVKALIDAGANVNAQGGLYGNTLQAAAVFKLRKVAELLLDRGAYVNALGGEYGTALQAACAKGAGLDLLKLLLDVGADVNIVAGKFGTALQAASATSKWRFGYQAMELLLENGAEVNMSGGKYGCALQAACQHADVGAVKLLLDHGADPNIYGGYYGCSLAAIAFHFSGLEWQPRVQMLIEQGADVNYEGGRYGTPLHAACMKCWSSVEPAEVLLTNGANASAQAGRYGTPLHTVLMHQRSVLPSLSPDSKKEDILRLINALLQRGAGINNTGGPGGVTALQGLLEKRLIRRENDEQSARTMLEYLLEKEADPNLGGGIFGFPLQSACALREDIDSGRAGMLLELCPKIDVNAQGGYFHTSLQAAAYTAQTEPIRIMLARGADVNTRGGRYGSALNAAVVQGFWDIAKTLMEAGAKPDCEIFSAPDQLWLWRLEEDDGRAAVRRYEKFWEVESGQEIPVVSMLAWLDLE